MPAIGHVFTIKRVAEMLGEDEDWLYEVCLEMMPEDGLIAVYGVGEDYTPAFTRGGIDNLRELVEIHKENARRSAGEGS